jgi:hypothetical protein
MAVNIDRVILVKNVGDGPWAQAYLDAQDVVRLCKEIDDDRPERCFLFDLDVDKAINGKVKLTGLQWSGECSGRSYNFFEGKVVPAIKGEVVALVSWERGEQTVIWHIKDGELEEVDVFKVLKNPDILQACLNYDRKE